jgi:hypothetical protein
VQRAAELQQQLLSGQQVLHVAPRHVEQAGELRGPCDLRLRVDGEPGAWMGAR